MKKYLLSGCALVLLGGCTSNGSFDWARVDRTLAYIEAGANVAREKAAEIEDQSKACAEARGHKCGFLETALHDSASF